MSTMGNGPADVKGWAIYGTVIELPLVPPPASSIFYDPTPGELFKALETESRRRNSCLARQLIDLDNLEIHEVL